MKKAIQLTLIIMVAIMMVPPLMAADLKVIKLRHADNAPPHAGGNIFYREKWLPRINEQIAKDGYKLDITMYHSSSLYKYADQVQALEDGLIDISCFVPSWEKARAPLHLLISAPLMGFNAQSAQRIWFELQETIPEFGAEFSKYKEIYHFTMIPKVFNANKVVRTPADFKGLKVRVIGPGVVALKALGAEPIGLPSAEIYLAGRKGVIDAAVIPMGAVQAFKLDEVFNYSTFVPEVYNEGKYCVMNLKKWKTLTQEDQKIFNDAAAEVALWNMPETIQVVEKLKKEMTSKGAKIHQLSPEEKSAYLRECPCSLLNTVCNTSEHFFS